MTLALKAKDYKTEVKPIWCPRCGDFGLLSALYKYPSGEPHLSFGRVIL